MGCGDGETSSRWRGMRQLWGIEVRCEKGKWGRSIPKRERQKIKLMTTSLVDVSVVLL